MAIENQSRVDENMPVRNLIYDACNYNYQLKYAKRVHPIVSIVFYYGEDAWDKPKSINEMFSDYSYIEKYINDWNAHIFVADELDINKFKDKETRDFILLIQKFHKWGGHYDEFKGIKTTRDVIIALTPIIKDKKLLASLLEDEEGGEIDMCRSVERAMNAAENIGAEKGKSEGIAYTLATILSANLGRLSKDVESKIKSCTSEQSHNLMLHINAIRKEEDILSYLN